MKNKWTGKTLSEDLARTLQSANWMTWVNIPLGSVMHSSPQIADVLAVSKSFAHPLVKIYEIKVDRSDYFTDVDRDKYLGYYKSAHQVYFAVPQGLIKTAELPQNGVGLIVRSESTWHVVKASRRRTDYALGVEMLLKLLMRGYEDHWQNYRSEERRSQEVKKYTTLRQAFHDYGVKVGQDIARSQEIVKVANDLLREMGRVMHKDYEKSSDAASDLKRDVNQLMKQKRHIRLALPLAVLTINLFDGEIFYRNPVEELRRLLTQAEKEFPEKSQH